MDTEKLAIDGGAKTRTQAWPTVGKRFGEEELQELREALDQNTLFYMHGGKTKAFCAKLCQTTGAKFALACSSGTASIHAALKACGVGPGDEVITTPITDAGTVVGIIYEGAIPVFADVDPASYNITVDTIAARYTSRTRAVVVVHLQGNPADIKPIVDFCRVRNLRLIEDCAQAWGAKVDGQWVGTFGDIGCFSLNDFKHIGAGDGGAIVTNDEGLYRRAWLCIDKCYDRVRSSARGLPFCAPNYRITELQSAVAIAQLGKLDRIVSRRNELGRRLVDGLGKIDGLIPSKEAPGAYPTWWFQLIGLDPAKLGANAKVLGDAMRAEGIPCGSGYVAPVYLQYEFFRTQAAFNHSTWPFSNGPVPPYGPGYCPNAERVALECLNFPLNQWLSEQEIDDTLAATAKVTAAFRKRAGR